MIKHQIFDRCVVDPTFALPQRRIVRVRVIGHVGDEQDTVSLAPLAQVRCCSEPVFGALATDDHVDVGHRRFGVGSYGPHRSPMAVLLQISGWPQPSPQIVAVRSWRVRDEEDVHFFAAVMRFASALPIDVAAFPKLDCGATMTESAASPTANANAVPIASTTRISRS